MGHPVALVSVLIFLSSCQDHRIPSPTTPGFRIKRVAVAGQQQTSNTTYTYNSRGQLASIYKAYVMRARGSNIDTYYTSVLQYDSQGRVVSFENQPDYKAPGTVNPSIYTYNYDDRGNVVTINYVLNPQSPTSKRTFYVVYANNAKFPNRIKDVNENFNDETIYDYTYGGNNIVEIKKTSSNMSVTDFDYQFDDKPNPFYGLYPGVPAPELFNSIKQNTFYENNTFNQNNMLLPGYTYEYDSYGNLMKATGAFTTTYEYEQY